MRAPSAEKMKVLATIPLLHDPGAEFEYGLSIDLLGYLVEVVSGDAAQPVLRRAYLQTAWHEGHTFFYS